MKRGLGEGREVEEVGRRNHGSNEGKKNRKKRKRRGQGESKKVVSKSEKKEKEMKTRRRMWGMKGGKKVIMN